MKSPSNKNQLTYRHLFFLLAVFLFSQTTTLAQTSDIRFEHITVADGLAENSAKIMLQDHLGFIWMATQNGLHKYDGHDFTLYQYDPEDSTTIADDRIVNMWEDNEGNIWTWSRVAATENSISVFDRKAEQFRRMDNPFAPFQSLLDNSDATDYTMTPDAVFWAPTLKRFSLSIYYTK